MMNLPLLHKNSQQKRFSVHVKDNKSILAQVQLNKLKPYLNITSTIISYLIIFNLYLIIGH